MTKPSLSEWQRQVVTELAVIAEAFPDDLEALGSYRLDKTGSLRVPLRLTTGDIPRVVGGLPIGEHEEFDVTVGRSDLAPPRVEVDHTRFLHHAHVLQGQRLCLYMDPSREWDPLRGFGGFLDRLVDWLGVAAAGRFDAQTALYHAVGGVLHAADGAPTVVVRDAPAPGERAQHGWLVARTPSRFDLSLERSGDPENDGTEAEHVPVVMLDADLPFGAGTCLASFLVTVDDPYLGHPAPDQTGLGRRPAATGMSAVIPTVLGASAIRKPEGTPQRFIVSVPHPTGGPPHLVAAGIPAVGADHIRALVKKNRGKRPMVDIYPSKIHPETPLEWWPISDEREAVTTRRDSQRPVAAYAGRTVHVWGCGGIGAWMAEFVVALRTESLMSPRLRMCHGCRSCRRSL